MCFGCGKDNPHSLKMTFIQEGDKLISVFVPGESHQSWPGYVHGGALMTALDEGIGRAIVARNIFAVTAKIDIRLKSMAKLGEPLYISANVVKQTSRTVEVEAVMQREDESIVAEATAIMYIVQ
jgi:acyl-coenzyme A thioesterase PaaI-like protein